MAKDKGGFKMKTGSRAQVFHGIAKQTSGGLLKKDLVKNKVILIRRMTF